MKGLALLTTLSVAGLPGCASDAEQENAPDAPAGGGAAGASSGSTAGTAGGSPTAGAFSGGNGGTLGSPGGSGGTSAGAAGGLPGASGSGAATGDCVRHSDCALYADCCTQCIAVPLDYVPELCALPCVETCPDGATPRCIDNQCVVLTPCSDSSPCPATHFCNYADDRCGRGDPTGSCEVRARGCTDEGALVCGCGSTAPSGNECHANVHGMDRDMELWALDSDCVPAGVFDTRALGVWLWEWTDGSDAYIQIALCSDGRARYLHATRIGDPNPTLADGTYTAYSSIGFHLHFDAPPGELDVQYVAETDNLLQNHAFDGPGPGGVRFDSSKPWITPSLACD